jgi:hypothetical protein
MSTALAINRLRENADLLAGLRVVGGGGKGDGDGNSGCPTRSRSGSAGLGEGRADADDTFVPRLSQRADGMIMLAPN